MGQRTNRPKRLKAFEGYQVIDMMNEGLSGMQSSTLLTVPLVKRFTPMLSTDAGRWSDEAENRMHAQKALMIF